MDAFAVSVSNGISIRELKVRHAVKIAAAFGIFQFIMPLVGYFIGGFANTYISAFDHWIASLLLGFIGVKMIIGSSKKDSGDTTNTSPPRLGMLMVLAIATSIDALAVGISLAVLSTPVLPVCIWIGVITFVISFGGVLLGKKLGTAFGRHAQTFGGIVLIGIGLKILIEHLFF